MMRGLVVLGGLLCPLTSGFTFNADFEDSAWKMRPTTKVIGLLKDMDAQLSKEADEDEEMFQKMGCWCATNDQEKTKAIADGNQRVDKLTAMIESYSAQAAQLKADLADLEKDIADRTGALNQAAGIRGKENDDFTVQERDAVANTESLSSAVDALSGVHSEDASLSQWSYMQVREVMRHNIKSAKNPKHVISLLQQPVNSEEYAPQSGEVFGILKQMKESFATNLESSRTDEANAASEFADMKKSTNEQISAASANSNRKSAELADAVNSEAQAKQDLIDTKDQLAADTKFLATVKDTCANAESDYTARKKVRTEEIQAVSETIGILTDDDAQQAFSKSQSFIQLSLHTRRLNAHDQRRERAEHLLRQTAVKSVMDNRQLLALATRVRDDAFSTLKAAIDGMVTELKKTQKEEDEQHEFCNSQISKNDNQRAIKADLKTQLETKIADMDNRIDTLNEDMAALTAEIKQTRVEMQTAGANREAENQDFQVTVADQKATQVILKKALERLNAFYSKRGLLQIRAGQPAQGTYKKNTGAATGAVAVIRMLQNIMDESADVEKDALRAENEAQSAYEEYMADSSASINAAQENIASHTLAKAKAEKTSIGAKADLASTIKDILLLGEHSVALHQDCDFLIANFDVRKSSRSEEIDGLNNAKAVLSGANFGFLQQQN